MRKILLPWGGEMGIISLRCRVSAASGGRVACCRRWGVGAPCRCRAILFSSSLYHLLIGRATRIGPSRAAGKNFNLRGTGRNVRGGHSCFLCKSGGRQVLCGSQKRRHKNSSLCQFDCAMIEKLRDHKRAAALLRAAILLKERQCNSCF